MADMGAPTKLDKAAREKAEWYLDGGYEECGDVVPSRAGLACELNVSRTTIKNWESDPDFLVTLNRLDGMQERKALSGGLSNNMNSTIVKLVLANHGYSDRVQQDNISTDGSMSPKGKSLDDFYDDSSV